MAWENTPSDDTCQANSGSESSTTEYRRTENVQSGPVDQLDGEGQHHSETKDISSSDRPNDRAAAAALVQLHDPEQTMFQSGEEAGLNAGNFAEFERRDLIKLPFNRSFESASTFHPAVQKRSLPNPSYNVSNHPSTVPYTLPAEMCMQNTVSSLSKAVLSIQQQQTAMQQNQNSITGALRDMTSVLREAINRSLAQTTDSFHSERSNIVSAASQEQNSHIHHAMDQQSCINNDVQTDRSYSVQQYGKGKEYNNGPPSLQRERSTEVQYPNPFQYIDRSQGTSAMQADSTTARPGRFPSQSQVDRNGSIPLSAQNVSVLQYPYPPQSYTYGSLVAPSMQTDNAAPWKRSLPDQTQTNRHGTLPPQAQTPSALQCTYPVQDREGRFHQEWPTPLTPRYRESRYHRSAYENRAYSTPLPEAKLPPFTGKEEWKIWFNRFEAVARRRNWDEETKLDNLLPRLQGTAGDFVFSQLPQHTLSNYNNLVKELNSRFRVVETEKTFAAKFSQRCQRQGETAEEYAADLKRLYAKAYKSRDEKTRQEDLVRRFLDGLRDHEARFEIEFHKEPSNIEEAVYHAVNFVQTKRSSSAEAYTDRKFKKSIRRTSPDSEEESDGGEFIEGGGEYEQVMRIPCREEGKHLKKPQRGERKTEAIASNPVAQSESLKVLLETKELVQALANQISELKKTSENDPDEKDEDDDDLKTEKEEL